MGSIRKHITVANKFRNTISGTLKNKNKSILKELNIKEPILGMSIMNHCSPLKVKILTLNRPKTGEEKFPMRQMEEARIRF